MRMRSIVLAASALTLVLAGCSSGGDSGDTSSTTSSSSSGSSGGTLKVLTGAGPDSLDPSYGYTVQAVEADSMVYTPLMAYAQKSGTDGTKLIPGLAEAMPTVSADGLTYDLKLRSGLTYSDGSAVKASDFAFAIQRSIKLSWGGAPFFTQYIQGAKEYGDGTAQSISGITTDDATGAISIKLLTAYGAFANILAFPAAAPIPATTPMEVATDKLPVGVGPYKFGTVVPNQSYTLVKNDSFKSAGITGLATGYVDEVTVTKQSNTTTEAQQVLNGEADLFDPADTIPSGSIQKIKATGSERYAQVPTSYTMYIFMNTTEAPFNNAEARQAVNMALDRTAIARLASGTLQPGCYFLPPSLVGHPKDTSACPGGDPTKAPTKATVAKAKKMIADAGLAGTPVTVWSQTRSPRQQYMAYYTNLLNDLGFKATLKVLNDTVYFNTVGNAETKPQTGFGSWSADFPNPSNFYYLLSAGAIQPTNSVNYGLVNDPKIESQIAELFVVPSGDLESSRSSWESLEKYTAQQSFVLPMGYQTAPRFISENVDPASYYIHPVNYTVFSQIKLK